MTRGGILGRIPGDHACAKAPLAMMDVDTPPQDRRMQGSGGRRLTQIAEHQVSKHQGRVRPLRPGALAARVFRAQHLRAWCIGLLCVAAVLGAAAWAYQRATVYYLTEASQRGENTLRLATATLRGQLARYEPLPQLIAQQRVIVNLLSAPDSPGRIAAANQYLRATATILEASDIYVMQTDGNTLAASNFNTDVSFIGGNFAFRPYFLDALSDGQGRFFALGTTSLKRGYYFGAPILVDGAVQGVLVIKIDLDEIEEAWGGGDYQVLVTDPEGIVFLSSYRDWTFRALLPLTPERLARTGATRRYASTDLLELPHQMSWVGPDLRLMTVPMADATPEFVVVSEPMPDAGWTVNVLLNTASARVQARTMVTTGMLLVVLAALSVWVVRQQRRALADRLELQRTAREDLERRVAERTAQLGALNTALESEVAERRATETVLRQTQADLIQAGKLAALGQMSAALSHEFNQPLAATRNYAENAQLLLDRGRVQDAHDNVGRIVALVDRMTRISRHLRNFARKPNAKLTVVELAPVVQAMQEMMAWRFEQTGAVLDVDLGPGGAHVIAGPVRLQQVLVNLVSNALDATEGAANRTLHLRARVKKDTVRLILRDHGPGVLPGLGDRIFDPFFSTKGVGKGLGLGLSISYNIMRDFGGDLSVRNHPGGGAEFTLTLRAARADMEAAE